MGGSLPGVHRSRELLVRQPQHIPPDISDSLWPNLKIRVCARTVDAIWFCVFVFASRLSQRHPLDYEGSAGLRWLGPRPNAQALPLPSWASRRPPSVFIQAPTHLQQYLVIWNNSIKLFKITVFFCFFIFYPSVTHAIMKGQQALGSVTHALMREHYPYRPGHPGAHLCPAKSMVETAHQIYFTGILKSSLPIRFR